MDRKEAILQVALLSAISHVQGLVAYLGESEQQDHMSARSHIRNLDTLVALQEERIAQVRNSPFRMKIFSSLSFFSSPPLFCLTAC